MTTLRQRIDTTLALMSDTPLRNLLRAMFDDLLADKWQPISTMPRDGTTALLWSEKAGYTVGNWPVGNARGVWTPMSGEWYGSATYEAKRATHWQPLPAPPSMNKEPT